MLMFSRRWKVARSRSRITCRRTRLARGWSASSSKYASDESNWRNSNLDSVHGGQSNLSGTRTGRLTVKAGSRKMSISVYMSLASWIWRAPKLNHNATLQSAFDFRTLPFRIKSPFPRQPCRSSRLKSMFSNRSPRLARISRSAGEKSSPPHLRRTACSTYSRWHLRIRGSLHQRQLRMIFCRSLRSSGEMEKTSRGAGRKSGVKKSCLELLFVLLKTHRMTQVYRTGFDRARAILMEARGRLTSRQCRKISWMISTGKLSRVGPIGAGCEMSGMD